MQATMKDWRPSASWASPRTRSRSSTTTCLTQARTGTRPRRSRRPTACWGRDEGPPSDEELAPLGGEATGFELITQVYEPADQVRRMEVAFALAKNLRNTRIRKVHVLAENGRDGRFASTIAALVGATHLHVQILGRRLRFSDAEGYAAASLPRRAVILSNADVFFDEDSLRRLGDARTLDLDRRVLALLRWEWTCGFDVEGMDLKTLVAACVEINRCVGALAPSSGENRHRHAVEQVS